MDDLKFSHKDPAVLTEVITWLEPIYGHIDAKRGKVHDYIGMTLDFGSPKKVKIIMQEYVEDVLGVEDRVEDLVQLGRCKLRARGSEQREAYRAPRLEPPPMAVAPSCGDGRDSQGKNPEAGLP